MKRTITSMHDRLRRNATLSVLVVSTCANTMAQNLIPNGSFEEIWNSCTTPVYFAGMVAWSQPGCCFDPTYVSACYNDVDVYYGVPQNRWGYQEALDGQVYVGFRTFETVDENFSPEGNPFNYIQVEFAEPLGADQRYCLRLGLSLQDSTFFSTDNLNALFMTDTAWGRCKQRDTLWQDAAQITFDISTVGPTAWTLLEQEFIAAGGETKVIIGSFQFGDEIDTIRIRPPGPYWESEYAGYWLDNVRLVACNGVGMDERPAQDVISLRSNAVRDELFVVSNALQAQPYAIYALDGQLLSSGLLLPGDNRLSIAMCAEGIYLFSAVGKQERFVVVR